MSDQVEIPLHGGRVTKGVVRVGNSVRRPPTANSAFVHRLLRHLAGQGFGGAPASMGMDERGRDAFAFMEGDVPTDLAFHADQTLRQAAGLIRRFHDAAAGLVATSAAIAVGIETICHNDLSPCNFVFQDDVPVAIIDFDAAAPGSRDDDLGYAAWLWLDLGSPDIAAAVQARRLALFLEAYGDCDLGAVLDATLARQAAVATRANSLDDRAMAGWAEGCGAWTLRHRRVLGRGRDRAFLGRGRDRAFLGRGRDRA